MKILIVCEDFRIGGAQVFVLRLANALSKKHEVWLYSHYDDYINWKLVQRIAPGIKILYAHFPLDWFIRKFDRLLYKINIDFSWREKLIVKHLKRVVVKHEIELMHSHMFKSDFVVAKALQGTMVPLVITMHGGYENFLEGYLKKDGEYILRYPEKLRTTLINTTAIAYLTKKNLNIFNEPAILPSVYHRGIVKRKIYNGFLSNVEEPHSRDELGIGKTDLVFGLVARGIPEKGWETAIHAFNKLCLVNKNIHLVLVGWSEYVQVLSLKHKSNQVHFVGCSENSLDWIYLFDIGLLPSVFKSESLPNVIVEYLYLNKPVICTEIGEAKNMITYDEKQAGFTIKLDTGRLNIQFAEYMKMYIENPTLIEKHQAIARKAYIQFSMEKCIEAYENLYEEVIPKN